MKDFVFKSDVVAMVQVRADDEQAAREMVPAVLRAPDTTELRMANQNNNDALGKLATVASVDFFIGQIKTSKPLERRARLVAFAKSWRRE
jgi:hypothetical protein